MLAETALCTAAVSRLQAQGNAHGAYESLKIPGITNAKLTQSIEKRGVVSPSRSTVSRAARASTAVKIEIDGPPEFTWPASGRLVPEICSCKSRRRNDGINIAVREDAVVKAAADGIVAYAGEELKGYGNVVFIRHSNNWVTAYAYNRKLLIKRGDKVREGQPIAVAGRVGSMTFPQLHFEMRRGSESIDPLDYLPKHP